MYSKMQCISLCLEFTSFICVKVYQICALDKKNIQNQSGLTPSQKYALDKFGTYRQISNYTLQKPLWSIKNTRYRKCSKQFIQTKDLWTESITDKSKLMFNKYNKLITTHKIN